MKVLLDTCVLSEVNRENGLEAVRTAVEEIPEEHTFISVITIGEIAKGIDLLEAGLRRKQLHSWLNATEINYSDRLLGVDSAVARIWGELTAKAQRNGYTIQVADGIIATTAIRYGCHVMTRNASDFEPTGALLINPW